MTRLDDPHAPLPGRRRRSKRRLILALLMLLPLPLALWAFLRPPALPRDLRGALVYVSDRSGVDTLFERGFQTHEERILTRNIEPVRSPRISPDGRRVAVEMGGRVAVVDRRTAEMRVLTLGVDWKDAAPAWRPDSRALVVASRRDDYARGDLHLLEFDERAVSSDVARIPLPATVGLDAGSPVFSPDGIFIIFIREEHIFRVAASGESRPERLTGGFKKCRTPRFLPDGRIVFLWSRDKTHGIDRIQIDGGKRETLYEGSIFYRDLAPSPDGTYLAATFGFDLAFRPLQALSFRRGDEIHLLRVDGRHVGVLARSSRSANRSPDWTGVQ